MRFTLSLLRLASRRITSKFGPQGQVQPADRLGEWIHLLSSEDAVHKIVEIGTWKGLGTTLIVANAIAQRDNVSFVSLEANRNFHDTAVKNLRKKRVYGVNLIWGSIISSEDLDSSELTAEEKLWLEQDLSALESCPDVKHLVPDEIDLLILDGGEFSTWSEFNWLLPRVRRFIVLDDTRVRKSKKADRYLESSSQFVRVGHVADRNGLSVWTKAVR